MTRSYGTSHWFAWSGISLSWVRNRFRVVSDAVERVSLRLGASVLDVSKALLPDDVCGSATSDLVNYRDATHITTTRSGGLGPKFLSSLVERPCGVRSRMVHRDSLG